MVAACAVALVGCGDSGTPQAAGGPVTVTATSTVTQIVETPAETASDSPTAPAKASKAAKPSNGKIVVPSGVGLDYQAAQDTWRGAGLHVAPGVDATGANRLPLIDSNWVVLSQNPKAGTKVDADSIITATVKKFTDD